MLLPIRLRFRLVFLFLVAATLCFLISVFALLGQASCHSAVCRSGGIGTYRSLPSYPSLLEWPFVLRRADSESEPGIGSAALDESTPSTSSSSQRLSSSTTATSHESPDYSSSSDSSSSKNTSTTDPSPSSGTNNAAATTKTLHDILPFVVVVLFMLLTGIITGLRCALWRRRSRHGPPHHRRLYLPSALEEDKTQDPSPHVWIDKHTTSRKMWSMLASKKGISPRLLEKEKKQKVAGRPGGGAGRRTVSEGGVSTSTAADPFSDPPLRPPPYPSFAVMEVGFGVYGMMMTDEPEPVVVQDGPPCRPSCALARLDVDQSRLSRSKSSPDVRTAVVRRSSGGPLIYSPSRPSPLRHCYLTP